VFFLVGNDEKISFDETGKTVTHPPVNLAITPDQHLALVANSLDWVKDGEGWNGGRRSSAISQGSRLISSSPNSS
jgi:hypothetical protein